ncbi:MAG: helix-turn-helix domain-containing protein, partial [Nocardioides sp.]
MDNVEDQITVSGNPLLAGAVSVGAAAIAGAYAVRAVDAGGALAPVLAAGALGALAVLWAAIAWDARAPRMVIDRQGVRVRFARQWIGLAWADLDGMSVRGRRRMARDGRLVPISPEESALSRLRWPSRCYAAWLASVFGDPYVVPLGWTTRIAGAEPDLATAVARLSDSEVRTAGTGYVDTESVVAESSDTGTSDTGTSDTGHAPTRRLDLLGTDTGLSTSHPGPSTPASAPSTRTPLVGVAALAQSAATMSGHRDVVTVGANALDSAMPEPAHADALTSALPEIEELRRPAPELDDLAPDIGPAVVLRTTSDEVPAGDADPLVGGTARINDPRDGQSMPGHPIGAVLSAARLRLRLSVDQLSERTRIRP